MTMTYCKLLTVGVACYTVNSATRVSTCWLKTVFAHQTAVRRPFFAA